MMGRESEIEDRGSRFEVSPSYLEGPFDERSPHKEGRD